MKKHRIGVRVSAELHALLAAAGDVSAATRALSILGAHAAGYALGDLRDEAASLLAAPLDPPVRTALRGLLVGCWLSRKLRAGGPESSVLKRYYRITTREQARAARKARESRDVRPLSNQG